MNGRYLLVLLLVIISLPNTASAKDKAFSKMFEKWVKHSGLHMYFEDSSYVLWSEDSLVEYPVTINDSLFYMNEFFYYEVKIDLVDFKKNQFEACDFVNAFPDTFFGKFYTRDEKGKEIIYLEYELAADLSPYGLYSVVEYLSQYARDTRMIAEDIKRLVND